MGAQQKIEAAAFPLGLFSPVPREHTLRSGLASSLALLRQWASELDRAGYDTTTLRWHIAQCEPLVEMGR